MFLFALAIFERSDGGTKLELLEPTEDTVDGLVEAADASPSGPLDDCCCIAPGTSLVAA
jgi:hypothetical protein